MLPGTEFVSLVVLNPGAFILPSIFQTRQTSRKGRRAGGPFFMPSQTRSTTFILLRASQQHASRWRMWERLLEICIIKTLGDDLPQQIRETEGKTHGRGRAPSERLKATTLKTASLHRLREGAYSDGYQADP
jgi:hypothetical protein